MALGIVVVGGNMDPADYYNKTQADKLLAKKLDLTGGTMTGTLLGMLGVDVNAIEFTKSVKGDNMIRLRNTETGADVGIGIGGLGSGIGIWDFTQEQWLINGVLNEKSIFIGNQYCAGFVVASGSNYVRFGDGTQICWGMVKSPKLTALQYGVGSKFTFPVAFANNTYAVASSFTFDAGYGGNLKIHSSALTNTYADILFLNTGNNEIPAGSDFRLIFIGRWK